MRRTNSVLIAPAWVSSDSAKERRQGLSVLSATAPDEVIEPVFAALQDADKRVGTMAFVILLGNNPPSTHGERIVTQLGGEFKAAQRFVQSGWAPGASVRSD